jgi:hypothetical protein
MTKKDITPTDPKATTLTGDNEAASSELAADAGTAVATEDRKTSCFNYKP